MTEISISAIAAFSHDGRVHRAFDHLIAAGAGTLLCVPLAASAGDLRQVVDGCPVPWDEVLTVIDTPLDGYVFCPQIQVRRAWPMLASFAEAGWRTDHIQFGAGTVPVPRLVHQKGIVFSTLRR